MIRQNIVIILPVKESLLNLRCPKKPQHLQAIAGTPRKVKIKIIDLSTILWKDKILKMNKSRV